jgi:preprotein translocase subunit SecB
MVEPQVAPTVAPGDGTHVVQFSIEKIYVKDLSLENPSAPQSFQMTEVPQIEIAAYAWRAGRQGHLRCVLTITAAKSGDKTVFLVGHAGQIFGIRGVTPDQPNRSSCIA